MFFQGNMINAYWPVGVVVKGGPYLQKYFGRGFDINIHYRYSKIFKVNIYEVCVRYVNALVGLSKSLGIFKSRNVAKINERRMQLYWLWRI